MRNFKNLMLLFMATAAIGFTSCSKDDDGGNGGDAGSGTVTAKVNGSNFTSMEMASVANLVNSQGVMTIQGSDASGKAIVMIINNYDGTGTYTIGGANNIFVSASYVEANPSSPTESKSWMAPYDDSAAGTISIAEVTTDNVKGTFEFEAKNSQDGSIRTITDGSFNVELRNN